LRLFPLRPPHLLSLVRRTLVLYTVGLGTGGFLLVDADDLEAATLGKGTQIAFLPIA
jgi:hypothetical protein